MANNKTALPDGWRWVRLGEVCRQDHTIIDPKSPSSAKLIYLGLEHIESNTGRILREPVEHITDEIQSITFLFDNRHVLYGKLRPYLNKVALPDFRGRCTTELIPILPLKVDREYLAWVLRRQETVNATMEQKTGSRMPRTNMDNLFTFEIPLPPLPEQQRIAARLNEQMAAVAKAHRAAEEQLRAARELSAAYLIETVDYLGEQDFPRKKLGEFIITCRNGFGRRPTGPENDGVIVLRLADVTGGNINLNNPRRVRLTTNELQTYQVSDGDLLFVRVNGSKDLIGRCAVIYGLQESVAYNDHLIRVRLNDCILPEFVKLATETRDVRNFIVEKASTSAGQLTINQEMINSLEIVVPQLEEQRRLAQEFMAIRKSADNLIACLESQLSEINQLPAALLRQAFSGKR